MEVMFAFWEVEEESVEVGIAHLEGWSGEGCQRVERNWITDIWYVELKVKRYSSYPKSEALNDGKSLEQ